MSSVKISPKTAPKRTISGIPDVARDIILDGQLATTRVKNPETKRKTGPHVFSNTWKKIAKSGKYAINPDGSFREKTLQDKYGHQRFDPDDPNEFIISESDTGTTKKDQHFTKQLNTADITITQHYAEFIANNILNAYKIVRKADNLNRTHKIFLIGIYYKNENGHPTPYIIKIKKDQPTPTDEQILTLIRNGIDEIAAKRGQNRDKDDDYNTRIIFLKFTFAKLLGGCIDLNYTPKATPYILQYDGENIALFKHSYQSKTPYNNCGIMCLRKIYDCKTYPNAIRDKLNITKDTLLEPEQILKINETYEEFTPKKHILIVNEKHEILNPPEYESEEYTEVILLEGEHYYHLKETSENQDKINKKLKAQEAKANKPPSPPKPKKIYGTSYNWKERILYNKSEYGIMKLETIKRQGVKLLSSLDVITLTKCYETNKLLCIINDNHEAFDDARAFTLELMKQKDKVIIFYDSKPSLNNYDKELINIAIEAIKMDKENEEKEDEPYFDNKDSIYNETTVYKMRFKGNLETFRFSSFLTGDLQEICKTLEMPPPMPNASIQELLRTYHNAFLTYNETIYKKYKFNVAQFCSTGHFTKSVWMDAICNKLWNIYLPNEKVFHFIENAIYGARCGAYIRSYTTKGDATTYKTLLESNDYLQVFDINSHYGASMAGFNGEVFEYPFGEPFTCLSKEENEKHFNNNKHGFYYVNLTPPKKLYIAPIPSKQNDKLAYNLLPVVNQCYTLVDLQEAKKHNYEIEFLDKALIYPDTFNPFADYINDLYEIKQTTKSKSLYRLSKNCITQLYGKLMQNKKTSSKGYLINNDKELDEIENDPALSFDEEKYPISSETFNIMFYKKQNQNPYTTPTHLAAYVLSYSRKIMNFYIDLVDGFNSPVIHYIDTDSLRINAKHSKPLLPFIDNKLGYLKSECEGLIYNSFTNSPKHYYYQYIKQDDTTDKKLTMNNVNFKPIKNRDFTKRRLTLNCLSQKSDVAWNSVNFFNNIWFPLGYYH